MSDNGITVNATQEDTIWNPTDEEGFQNCVMIGSELFKIIEPGKLIIREGKKAVELTLGRYPKYEPEKFIGIIEE